MASAITVRVDYDVFPLDKTSIQTPMKPQDKFFADNEWHSVTIYFAHGKAVDKIDVMTPTSQYTLSIGDVLAVRNLGGRELVHVRIDRIRMIDTSLLSVKDDTALGFISEEAYSDDGTIALSGRVWMFDITPVDSAQ
jgi:hypothetical protein